MTGAVRGFERAQLHLFMQGATDRAKGIPRDCKRDARYPSDHAGGWRNVDQQAEWLKGWDATDQALAAKGAA
jgi:hypothetical protein